jgi:hypothetical protein
MVSIRSPAPRPEKGCQPDGSRWNSIRPAIADGFEKADGRAGLMVCNNKVTRLIPTCLIDKSVEMAAELLRQKPT